MPIKHIVIKRLLIRAVLPLFAQRNWPRCDAGVVFVRRGCVVGKCSHSFLLGTYLSNIKGRPMDGRVLRNVRRQLVLKPYISVCWTPLVMLGVVLFYIFPCNFILFCLLRRRSFYVANDGGDILKAANVCRDIKKYTSEINTEWIFDSFLFCVI